MSTYMEAATMKHHFTKYSVPLKPFISEPFQDIAAGFDGAFFLLEVAWNL